MCHSPVQYSRFTCVAFQLQGLHVILKGFRCSGLIYRLMYPFAVTTHWKYKQYRSAKEYKRWIWKIFKRRNCSQKDVTFLNLNKSLFRVFVGYLSRKGKLFLVKVWIWWHWACFSVLAIGPQETWVIIEIWEIIDTSIFTIHYNS